MTNPATIPAAATCPDWCTARDEPDHFMAWPSGEWDVTHEGADTTIATDEDVDPGVAVSLSVGTDSFVCNHPGNCRRRSLWVMTEDSHGRRECLTMTARQALRLAEVLVQQAAAMLAEDVAAEESR